MEISLEHNKFYFSKETLIEDDKEVTFKNITHMSTSTIHTLTYRYISPKNSYINIKKYVAVLRGWVGRFMETFKFNM